MSSSQRLCLPASGCWAIGHLLCPDPTIPYKASLADGDDREVGLLPAANELEPTILFAGIGMLGHRAPPLPRSYHPLQGVFGGRIRTLRGSSLKTRELARTKQGELQVVSQPRQPTQLATPPVLKSVGIRAADAGGIRPYPSP